jgi:hypothetical protein
LKITLSCPLSDACKHWFQDVPIPAHISSKNQNKSIDIAVMNPAGNTVEVFEWVHWHLKNCYERMR